jgi:hypothetical protein
VTVVRLEGPLGDLAEALGLIEDGELQGEFLADPGTTLKGMLLDADRRAKLLSLVQTLLAQADLGVGPAQTVDGRDWLPIVGSTIGDRTATTSDHVDLSIVLDHTDAAKTIVGLGIRFLHDDTGGGPQLAADAIVPFVVVPVTGDPSLAPGSADGEIRIEVRLEPRIEGGDVDFETLSAVVDLPTDGARDPRVVVTAHDVRLGDADPLDFTLDTASPIVEQALHVGATLLQGLAASADPRLAALLRLVGLGADPAIPSLPLQQLLEHGRAAVWQWLQSLATPAVVRAWVDALAALVSTHAVVDGDGGATPARMRLAVGQATLELSLRVRNEPDGTPVLVPRAAVDVETPLSVATPRLVGRAEVDLLEFRLATTPSAKAVPDLRVFGRVGPDAPRGTAPPLINQTTPVAVVVGSFAAGLELDAERRAVPLLRAYEVHVGTGARTVDRPHVDLTDADALADLGSDTLDELVDEALAALGASDEVRAALALLGLRDPHGFGGAGEPAWTHRVDLGALLADPLHALSEFIGGVARVGDTPALLRELARLLPIGGGAPPAIGGSGTDTDPWTLALDDDPSADVLLTCVRSAADVEPLALRLGLRVTAAALDLGAAGRLGFELDGDLLHLTMPSPGAPSAALVGSIAARARLSGAGGQPLRLGSAAVAVSVNAFAGGLRWSAASGLHVTGEVDALELRIDGVETPLALPRIDPATGQLDPPEPPPWEALEALAGHSLQELHAPWARATADVLGWGRSSGGPGTGAHLSLADLVADPLQATLDFLRGLVAAGAREVVEPLLVWLAGVVGDVASGEDAADAALRGTGAPDDPWAIRLRTDRTQPASAGSAARIGELLMWCEPDGPALPYGSDLTALALPSWLVLATDPVVDPPTSQELVDALREAAPALPQISRIVSGRGDLAASLGALRERLAGGDGVLPAVTTPTPQRWTARMLAGVAHAELQSEWEDATVDPAATLFVTGPLGDPTRWPLHDTARVVDLTTAGLPAEAFDVSAVRGGAGPWFVVLPTRAAARVDPTAAGDGLADLAARLQHVVDAAREHAGGPVTVVAHSTTGLPARLIAADAANGVGRLITLGTPLGGAEISFLDVRPTGDGVLALRALWQSVGLDPDVVLAAGGDEHEAERPLFQEVRPAAAMLAALDALAALDPFPAADFAAPAAWPTEAAAVVRESVTGALDAAEVQRAIALTVRAALHAGLAAVGSLPAVAPPPVAADDAAEESETPPARRPVQAIATGARHDLTSAPDARGVVVGARVTVAGPRLGDPGEAPEGEEPAPFSASAATDTTPATDERAGAPLPSLRAPAIEVRIVLRRENGWLVGGPRPEGSQAPAARPPRLRWAELVLGAEVRGGGAATAAIVLHEAAALGVERTEWTLRLGEGATLPAEARLLLFRLASALGTTDDAGALPATGASRALVDLLVALGLAMADAQGRVALVSEAVERLLLTPGTLLRDAAARGPDARRELTRTLRVLAGTALPGDEGGGGATAAPAPARVDVTVDGLQLVLDLDAMTAGGAPRVAVHGDVALAGPLALQGGVQIDAVAGTPAFSGGASLGVELDSGAPSGLPSVALDVPASGAPTLELRFDLPDGIGAAWLPRRVPLFPGGDPAQFEPLLRVAVAHAPAELLRLGAEQARRAPTGAQAAALDALLDALGLLGTAPAAGPRPVRVPLALVADPTGWFRRALALDSGGSAASLIDALRELLGVGTATTPTGHLPLPYGLELAVQGDATSGGLTLALATAAPVAAAGAEVTFEGGVRLRIDPVAGVRAQPRLVAGIGVRPSGAAAAIARVQVTVEDAVALALVLPGPPERTFPLVPAGTGFGDLVGAAAVRLLPVVLDAVAAHGGDVSTVVGELGDSLALRRPKAGGGREFDPAALSALAADPGAALLTRLQTASADVLQAFGHLAHEALSGQPAGFVLVSTPTGAVEVAIAGRVTLALRATGTGLRLEVGGDVPVRIGTTALGSVEAAVAVDQHGIASASAGVDVDGELLAVLGVPLRPWVRAHVSPADRSPSGTETPASRPTVEAGVRVPAAATAPERVVVVRVAPAETITVAVLDGTGAAASDDPALAIVRVLVPLLAGIATEALQDAFSSAAGTAGDTVGDVFDGVLVRQVGGRWLPLPDLLDPDQLLARAIRIVHNIVDAYAPALDLRPAQLAVDANIAGSVFTGSIRLSVEDGQTWWLVDAGDVRVGLEVETDWLALTPADGGLSVGLTIDPTASNPIEGVAVGIRGVTLRVAGREGGDLLDLGVLLRSVALSAAYTTNAPVLHGGRLALDRFAIPIGSGGGNAVASKLLDSDSTGSGDTQRPAPAISPELSLLSRDGGDVSVDIRMGAGDGPWWLPLQQQLGPMYIEQVGFGVLRGSGDTVIRLRLLVDGGVSLAGLTVQVDDLELRLPWPEPWDVSHWELDLAGLAVGYESSGVSLAGALIRTPDSPPAYMGLVTVKAAGFGINAFGGFGVYPVPNDPAHTYVSFFVIAALHAPLGGPPAFFVTGVGGGIGINRQLILPAQVETLPQFPLVQALDPGSDIASDPMGALRRMGIAFPPQRGAVWFAAGVSFTSFSLVEGVAVLSVSVGEGDVEIALLGLARLGLPNPRLPLAQIELALIARFSTRDMVLWIQAQLTDNSWVISRDARLTGGFAFVTWFRTGDFVVTLGGYHPRFNVPAYPQVPRLGLSWTLGEYLSIRGESYFALTSSAVMAGARIDVSFRAGPAYARIIAGFDALVKFDPLWFEVDVYASVTGGIRIRISLGWFGHITIDLSISIGARLHVEGPEVRGTATLEMGPVDVPFRFGPSGALDRAELPWTVFRDKYLVAGGGQILSIALTAGQLAAPASPEQSRNDGADPAKPWLVLPEFSLAAATTLAAASYAGSPVPGVGGLAIGPMNVAALSSDWRVTIRAVATSGAAGDRTSRFAATPQTTGLPKAVWRVTPVPVPIPSSPELLRACTAVQLVGQAQVPATGERSQFDPYQAEQDRDKRKPLPFPSERSDRSEVQDAGEESVRIDVDAVPQGDVMATMIGWMAADPLRASAPLLVPHGVNGNGSDPAAAERLRLLERRARAWQAVPRPVRITEGLAPAAEKPVKLEDGPAPPEPPPLDRSVGSPRVVALLGDGHAVRRAVLRTTVTRLASGAAAASLPRRAAPSTDVARAVADRAVAARLVLAAPTLVKVRSTLAPTDGGVRTRQAGGFAELRATPAADADVAKALTTIQKKVLGEGTSIVPGQAIVLELPNPHDDADDERPVVTIAGDAAVRVVALDAAGRPLADATTRDGRVEIPPRTARVALVGVGVAAGELATAKDDAAAGLAGWHVAARVAQVAAGVAVTPGGVVRGPRAARRDGTEAAAAMAVAGEVVRGVGLVETTLPPGVRTVVVALDRVAGGADAVDGLVVGFRGVRRRTGPDGELPPRVVAAGPRTLLLYAVEPETRDDVDAPGSVSIASDERWELAAVVGGTQSAQHLAEELALGGVEAMLAPLVPSSVGAATVTWTQGGQG